MKNYREIADSVFARREQYVTAQRKRKKLLASAGATLCAVSLLGGSVWYLNRPQHDIPVTPATDDGTVTTTVTTEGENTTTTTTANTTTDTKDTTTDGGVVVPTTTVITVAPTQTTAKPTTGKTEPSETTATTVPKKTVIAATEPDNNEFVNQSALRKKAKYISRNLRQMMKDYEGSDVVFAVYVQIPVMDEDIYEDFWNSNEEWAQIYAEYQYCYRAFLEEARQLNPHFGSNVNDIEVWTDTMRANYERSRVLLDEIESIDDQYKGPYVQSVLDQRFEVLKTVSGTEPIDIECTELPLLNVVEHAYYVELTHEQIDVLAEHGGFVFCLATLGQKDNVPGLLNE